MSSFSPRSAVAVLLFACLCGAVPAPAAAQQLRVGMAAAVTSMDPHYYNATPNLTIAFHVFEPLVQQDASGKPVPSLATSWRATGDTAWEFKLRDGVKWHDGKPFTAADVAFSLERVKNVPGAPGGFASMVNTIKSVDAIDPLTVRINTTTPAPNIPVFMTFVAMVSAEHGPQREDRGLQLGQGDDRHGSLQVREVRRRRNRRPWRATTSGGARSPNGRSSRSG
jgi:peptide/nickel transport system substrate-binding protein